MRALILSEANRQTFYVWCEQHGRIYQSVDCGLVEIERAKHNDLHGFVPDNDDPSP